MKLKLQLEKLATERNEPCVTLSLNTHRTHPENAKDAIALKNLINEARERVISEFGKRSVTSLLDRLDTIGERIDINKNLESLHIFLSNDTEEIVLSTWATSEEGVYVSDRFAVRSLVKLYSRNENYLLALLSQKGVHLYEAMNETIVQEIQNEDFPFPENQHYVANSDNASDPKQVDNMVREFLNKVDKAIVRVHHESHLPCVVICTEDNYSRLQQVADMPQMYAGYAPIDYNNSAPHQIVKQSWEIMSGLQQQVRTDAISEMKEAVAHGKVLTDLQEIYEAATSGRGELLIVHDDFSQAVQINKDGTLKLTDAKNEHGAVADLASSIAWEVMSKKGRVIFTAQDEINDLGAIVLKARH